MPANCLSRVAFYEIRDTTSIVCDYKNNTDNVLRVSLSLVLMFVSLSLSLYQSSAVMLPRLF